MHYPHDDHCDERAWHDRTWFDVLGEQLMQRARRLLPRNRAYLWTTGFALFAAVCVAWAAGLAAHATLFEAAPNQRLTELLAAGLLLAAARHFLGVTGMSAAVALPRRKLIRRPITPPTPTAVAEVAATGSAQPAAPVHRSERPAPPDAAADAQMFFRAVREAGINVRIAQSLYAAGFRSAQQVRACSDARLLATPGVGQATLRKLRLQFGLPPSSADESTAHSRSNAA